MKRFALLIASFLFSAPSFAAGLTETQTTLTTAFETLVDKNDGSEAVLSLETFESKDSQVMSNVFKDAVSYTQDVELYDFRVTELFPLDGDADDRLAEISLRIDTLIGGDGNSSAFYCDRFVAKPANGHACSSRTVELLSVLAQDPEARVFLALIDGNAYGSYRTAVLYVAKPQEFDVEATGTVLKLTFDIVHEI